jgi:hypothetical protein
MQLVGEIVISLVLGVCGAFSLPPSVWLKSGAGQPQRQPLLPGDFKTVEGSKQG